MKIVLLKILPIWNENFLSTWSYLFFFTIFPTKTKLTVLLFFNDYFLQTVEYVCACIILTVKNNWHKQKGWGSKTPV